MTITLITGGCGFIGSYLVKKLVADNRDVRVLDNCDRGSASRLNDVIDKIEFIQGDIRDPELVEKVCKGVSTVHHLAYINGTQNFYTKPEDGLDKCWKGHTVFVNPPYGRGIGAWIKNRQIKGS